MNFEHNRLYLALPIRWSSLTLIMDKAPEAAAMCKSVFPLFGSVSVSRCRSSWSIAYNIIDKNHKCMISIPCTAWADQRNLQGDIWAITYRYHPVVLTHLHDIGMYYIATPITKTPSQYPYMWLQYMLAYIIVPNICTTFYR